MHPFKQKVYGYITHQNRLLVFRHLDFPEAGIQVPGGTVKPGEDFANAVLRETCEETGLSNLSIDAFLGEQIRDMSDVGSSEVHHRRFYHLLYDGDPPQRWQHDETDPSDGTPGRIRLEFFWAKMPGEIPKLICDQGIMLPVLTKRLQNSTSEFGRS